MCGIMTTFCIVCRSSSKTGYPCFRHCEDPTISHITRAMFTFMYHLDCKNTAIGHNQKVTSDPLLASNIINSIMKENNITSHTMVNKTVGGHVLWHPWMLEHNEHEIMALNKFGGSAI